MSLTQIQLEEAMKPARYGAPVAQKLPVDARGSMVLDSGTTVASMAAKEKISGFVTGPVGSLLAGDKIQFGRNRHIFVFYGLHSSMVVAQDSAWKSMNLDNT